MGNLLEFLKYKEEKQKNLKTLNESFKKNDFDKALKFLTSIFKKKISNTLRYAGPSNVKQGNDELISYIWIYGKKCFTINFLLGNSVEPYSIDFYTDLNIFYGDKAKSKLTIYVNGNSIIKFIPTIIDVCNTDNYELKNGQVNLNVKNYNESYNYYIGALKYTIINENDLYDYRKQLRNEKNAAEEKWNKTKDPKDKEAFDNLENQYYELIKQINGGAKTLSDIKCVIKHDVVSYPVKDETIQKAEQQLEQNKKSPEQAFKELSKYVKMVASGLQPSLIVSGGPGIGKTYRIIKQLEELGYKDEQNMHIIKGKMSTRALYADLYVYRNKKQIIVFDDADSCVGPKADEDAINILKAALDSNPVRKISYHIKTNIEDERVNGNIPHSFNYEGSIIVITNYSIGKIDSAVKGRSFVTELSFDSKQMLEFIKTLMPKLMPDQLSNQSKQKAYDYLVELEKTNATMEISIRTFQICAKCFMMEEYDIDMTDEDAKSMIKDQMKGQSKKD